MRVIEERAADALLDNPLRVNLPAPWILRAFGKRVVPIWVRMPRAQTVIRMSRLFVRMDLDLKELTAGDLGTTLECIARNGETVSRVIAHGLLNGALVSRLLNRPLAWYIRCHMDLPSMAGLARIIVIMTSPQAFINSITLLATMNMLGPTVSHTGKGS